MFNCLCINDLFALQRYKNFWTFLLFPLCFKALSTIYLQVGNFSTLSDWTQRLTLISTIRHIDITLSGVLYHNELQNSPSVNTLLADAKLTWRIGKVRASATLRNLFNKKTYEETIYSGVGIFTNRYWLRPRELMVNVRFSL